MPDMLVKLYEMPSLDEAVQKVRASGVVIRRPNTLERAVVLAWIEKHFGRRWSQECETGFYSVPPTCFIAEKDQVMLGFACHDCTAMNFFGPTGVAESARGKGIGRALLLSCLHAMKDRGYAYAIIGGTGKFEFYNKSAGAVVIEGSKPGIYANDVRE